MRVSGEMVQGYVALSGILFVIGASGLLLRRSPLVMLMCVEVMLNAANLAFMAFSRYLGNLDGHVFAFFVVTVAAAEVAIGLAIIVLLFRRRDAADVDDINTLRG